jgi:hypothetical protein
MAFVVDRREHVLLGACSWVGACRAAAAVALRSGRHEPPDRCGVVVERLSYGWMPHNASFGFLDRPLATLGQIHF